MTENRRLEQSFVSGGVAPSTARDLAVLVVFRLFTQLSYIPTGGRAGHLAARDAVMLEEACGRPSSSVVDRLVDCGFLVPARDDDGWECPLFESLNRHLEPGRVAAPKRSALIRHHDDRMTRLISEGQEPGAGQLTLGMWKNPDGTDMDAETARKVRIAIVALDSGLRLADRPDGVAHWPPRLVSAVAFLVGEQGLDKIRAVARALLGFENHSQIPRTTEQVVERWKTVSEFVLRRNP